MLYLSSFKNQTVQHQIIFPLPLTQKKYILVLEKTIKVEPWYNRAKEGTMCSLCQGLIIWGLFSFYYYWDLVCFIFVEDAGATDESKQSSSPNAAAIAVPVVLLLLIIPLVGFAVFWYRRCVHYFFSVSRVRCCQWKRSHLSMMKSRILSHLNFHAVLL